MGLEKIPEQVLKETVFLWHVSRTEDSKVVFGAQSPLNSERHGFSCRHFWTAPAACDQNRVYSDGNCGEGQQTSSEQMESGVEGLWKWAMGEAGAGEGSVLLLLPGVDPSL